MATTKTRKRGNRHVRQWTKEKVQEAVQRWADKFGRPPTEADWNPARARFIMAGSQARVDRWKEALAEYEAGDYPSSRTLQDMYDGKWAEGIRDAGFVPLPAGRPSKENLSRYAKRKSGVDEAVLLYQIDQVQTLLKIASPNGMDLRLALLDLASVAATMADELGDTP